MTSFGKFFIDREIFEDDIWEKPAHFLKIWVWIVGRANWKMVKKGGKTYHRGEFLTSLEETQEANKWKVGWRTEKLSIDQVEDVYEFLRKTQRITTRKTTRGLWVKVLNYDYFQTLYSHETNSEGNNESNRVATAEPEGKEKERIKKENNISSVPGGTERRESSFEKKKVKLEDILDSTAEEIIAYFVEACQKKLGFTPAVSRGIEKRMIKNKLRPDPSGCTMPREQIIRLIDWFLDPRNKSTESLSKSLRVCLSTTVINRFLQDKAEGICFWGLPDS